MFTFTCACTPDAALYKFSDSSHTVLMLRYILCTIEHIFDVILHMFSVRLHTCFTLSAKTVSKSTWRKKSWLALWRNTYLKVSNEALVGAKRQYFACCMNHTTNDASKHWRKATLQTHKQHMEKLSQWLVCTDAFTLLIFSTLVFTLSILISDTPEMTPYH